MGTRAAQVASTRKQFYGCQIVIFKAITKLFVIIDDA